MNDNIDSNETIINLIDEIKFLNEFRKLLIISSIFFGVITFIYGLTLPKEYVSKVTFIPTDTNSTSGSSSALSGIAGLVGVTVSEGPTKKAIALAVLKSNIFLKNLQIKTISLSTFFRKPGIKKIENGKLKNLLEIQLALN